MTCTDAGSGRQPSITGDRDLDDGTISTSLPLVPAGKTVTGVVVKGGNAYNVYLPAALGALPWNGLHAPDSTRARRPAGISHSLRVRDRHAADHPARRAADHASHHDHHAAASVLPTKASTTPEDETSVEGTKAGRAPNVLPRTGSGMSLGTGLAISFGLLLGGAALLFVPRRLALEKGQHRRH